MSLNLSNLTEAAQKKISELSIKISIQKKVIEREQDVLRNKGETYICTRARNASQLRKDKLDEINEVIRIFSKMYLIASLSKR